MGDWTWQLAILSYMHMSPRPVSKEEIKRYVLRLAADGVIELPDRLSNIDAYIDYLARRGVIEPAGSGTYRFRMDRLNSFAAETVRNTAQLIERMSIR